MHVQGAPHHRPTVLFGRPMCNHEIESSFFLTEPTSLNLSTVEPARGVNNAKRAWRSVAQDSAFMASTAEGQDEPRRRTQKWLSGTRPETLHNSLGVPRAR